MRNKYKGFTLLELMITVVIVGIIASFALPSYSQYVLRSRRVEARQALQDIAQRIDQNYRITRNYKTMSDGKPLTDSTLAAWGMAVVPSAQNPHYELSFVADSINEGGYMLRAKAVGPFYDQSGVKMASNSEALPSNRSRDSLSIECWSR